MGARIISCIAVLLLLTTLHAEALDTSIDFPREPVFDHVTVSDGLSQNSVQRIIQDSCGYLWLATQDGLNKYDGYSFTVYRRSEDETGLTDSVIWSLYQDRHGDIWVGTDDGLNRYDRVTRTFTHYRHDPENDGTLSHPTVRDVLEDASGDLWVATGRGGLNRLDRSSGTFTSFRHDPDDESTLSSDRITSVAEDPRGFLWVGTEDAGVNRFDPVTGAAVRIRHNQHDAGSLSSDAVTRVILGHDGTPWIATDGGGLNRLDRDGRSFVRYRHDPEDPGSIASDALQTVFEDSAGRLWIGHYRGGGVSLLDRTTGLFARFTSRTHRRTSLNDDFVRAIYEDAGGILWFGTFTGGLNTYDPGRTRFRHYHDEWWSENSLSDDTVRAFYRDGNTLYIGTEGGLNEYDIESGVFVHYVHDPTQPGELPHNIVRNLYPDREGNLWIATHGGLSRFDLEKKTFTNFHHDPEDSSSISSDTVWRVFVDSRGLVWAGARNALNVLDPETGRFTRFFHDPDDPYSIAGDRILAIHEDGTGRIWAGSATRGVSVYDRETGLFHRYDHDQSDPTSLGSHTVFAILDPGDGYLWFGTRGGGINRFDPATRTFTRYTEAEGLPNDVVYGILADDAGYLWLSTNRGIARFSPADESFVAFDTSDGLQAEEFNNGAYYRADDGLMYFGGINGFNVFDPRRIQISSYNAPLAITNFRVLNDVMPVEQLCGSESPLTLTHRENYLSFEFASLDFSSPEKNRYAYKLEGIDRDWVYAGSRRYANYTNLPPGRYTFRVRGTNSDGVWSDNVVVLPLRISPAFWQTLLFRVTVLVTVVFLAVALYRYRTVAIIRENRRLETAVNERTHQLKAANEHLQEEVVQRKRAEEEIRRIAYYDYLTGLPNRRLFVSLCEQEIADRKRHGKRFCILFIDLDNFKAINDRFGHEAGDIVLIQTARRLKTAVRENDVIGRIGGDEFVLLLTDVSEPGAVATVAQKLAAAVRTPVAINDDSRVTTEASIGISSYPEDDDHLEPLIAKADEAMYTMKRDSREPEATGRIVFFHEIRHRNAATRFSREG